MGGYAMLNDFNWVNSIFLIACIIWLFVIIYQLRHLKPVYEEYGEGLVDLLKYRNAKVFELLNTILVNIVFIGIILDAYGSK
jgi:hypothetical protein